MGLGGNSLEGLRAFLETQAKHPIFCSPRQLNALMARYLFCWTDLTGQPTKENVEQDDDQFGENNEPMPVRA